MANASRWNLLIPFKEMLKPVKHVGLDRVDDPTTRDVLAGYDERFKKVADQEFENYKTIERWANNFPVPPIQTFHYRGDLAAEESDTYWLPFITSSAYFTGGLTTHGSGTVTATLNKNGTAVATLTCTATGLFVVDAPISWAKGDGMSAEITGAGTGCSGLVVQVLR